MIRRPPRSTQSRSSAASDVYKRQARSRIESLPCVRTLSRSTPEERSSSWPTGLRCGPESAGCSAATTAPHDAWAVLITVHGRLLTTCRRTSSRLEGSFLHGASWPTTVVSRCPWTSILQRGHDPLKFYESPGNGRCLGLALRAGFWGIGAVGSALPWHGRGQGFESPMLHSS